MGETMNKKLIKRYILLCIPFICGTLLYGIGFYGIVSSLLFFGGGYVVVKNIFDYRMVNKNIKKCIEKDLKIDNNDNIDILLLDENKVESKNILCNDIDVNNKYKYEYRKSDNIQGLKNTRRHIKIRRRY